MRQRTQIALWMVSLLMIPLSIPIFSTTVIAEFGSEIHASTADDWRNTTVNQSEWTDGPELEGSPMDTPQPNDPVIIINVRYIPGHGQSNQEGSIVIELFEQWAPITVTNMVEHVEIGLYDGIFFHRVIDDFVTQAGDPTCKTVGIYPATSVECGSGGTGETIPMEHDENLSHVDGAIGMARSTDPDSADSQWYICETEAHNLDPENRDDEGYATFGVVRDGMSHVRAIALTPTSDDPTGLEAIQNPLSSAGRPIYEARILSISMLGIIGDPNATTDNSSVDTMGVSDEEKSKTLAMGLALAIIVLLSVLAIRAASVIEPIPLYPEDEKLVAEIVKE